MRRYPQRVLPLSRGGFLVTVTYLLRPPQELQNLKEYHMQLMGIFRGNITLFSAASIRAGGSRTHVAVDRVSLCVLGAIPTSISHTTRPSRLGLARATHVHSRGSSSQACCCALRKALHPTKSTIQCMTTSTTRLNIQSWNNGCVYGGSASALNIKCIAIVIMGET